MFSAFKVSFVAAGLLVCSVHARSNLTLHASHVPLFAKGASLCLSTSIGSVLLLDLELNT